jgi:hypothetical protein
VVGNKYGNVKVSSASRLVWISLYFSVVNVGAEIFYDMCAMGHAN